MKIVLTILLPILSLLLFAVIFPTIGLYFTCFSVVVLFVLYFNLSNRKKIIISIILFCLTWTLLIDKAFEFQGQKIVGELCAYSNKKKMPDNTFLSNELYFNAFTPIFTKYHYEIKKDKPEKFEDIELSYKDLWGNYRLYCDADGEFEIRKLKS
ncbi:MAG: hypothetical protein WBM13_09705 [Bacteroidia bacterium]